MNAQPNPRYAITLIQPWAWAIASGLKTVENRPWATKHRGAVYVHAGKKLIPGELAACAARLKALGLAEPPALSSLVTGALIAVVDIVDCGPYPSDPWAIPGQIQWRLTNPRLLPEPIPMRGALGLWPVDLA